MITSGSSSQTPLHSGPLELVGTHAKQLDGVTMLVGIAVVGDVTRLLDSVKVSVGGVTVVGSTDPLQFNGTKRKK